jgi:hypothetical protein
MGEGNLHGEENNAKQRSGSAILMLPSLSKSEAWVRYSDKLKAVIWKIIGTNRLGRGSKVCVTPIGDGQPFCFLLIRCKRVQCSKWPPACRVRNEVLFPVSFLAFEV